MTELISFMLSFLLKVRQLKGYESPQLRVTNFLHESMPPKAMAHANGRHRMSRAFIQPPADADTSRFPSL